MAATASVRRALTREAVEAQVAGIVADRPLPPAYLVLAGLGEDGRDDFAVAFMLRCRTNGFMIAVPNVTRIREFIEGLLMEDGEPLALVQREQVQAETVRGRHLGPSHILLLDLPWSALHVVPPQALRGITDRAARVVTLLVETAQEYYASAQEAEEDHKDEAPDVGEPALPRGAVHP